MTYEWYKGLQRNALLLFDKGYTVGDVTDYLYNNGVHCNFEKVTDMLETLWMHSKHYKRLQRQLENN
jgi:hypothetical protein